tara:strand:- start:1417 stop:1596 length:180 start_codon:yes stop_codon:yes gene_type:complete
MSIEMSPSNSNSRMGHHIKQISIDADDVKINEMGYHLRSSTQDKEDEEYRKYDSSESEI